MINILILFFSLAATWAVLSGMFSSFFIYLGAISCFIATVFTFFINKDKPQISGTLMLSLKIPFYTLWLLREVIKSSLSITVKIWQIEPEIDPEISWISTSVTGDVGQTILGNSITLTPGTVTTDVREDGLMQVHSLTKEGLDDLRHGYMVNKVKKLLGIKGK